MVNIETLYGYRNEHHCVQMITFTLETKSRLKHVPIETEKMFDLVFLYTDFKFKNKIFLRYIYND